MTKWHLYNLAGPYKVDWLHLAVITGCANVAYFFVEYKYGVLASLVSRLTAYFGAETIHKRI